MKLSKAQWFIFVGLLIWCSLFFLQKTNLAASDLGRHIKNGQIIMETGKVFSNNLYSYTNPDFYAPNHHWLFGVISYVVYQVSGFAGLTLMGALLYTAAIAISAWKSLKISSLYPTVIATLIALPLFAHRSETRPEAFSLLFFGLIWWLLSSWLENKKSLPWLKIASLIAIMSLWINIHIFFILVIPLVGAAGVEILATKQFKRLTQLTVLGVSILAGCFINPLGLTLVLYPFSIFSNYGYRVAENQPIWFFLQYYTQPIHWYLLAFLITTSAALIYLWKLKKSYSLYTTLLFIFFAGFTVKLIRMENVLALISLPILAQASSEIWQRHHKLLKATFQKTWFMMIGSVATFGLIIVLLSSSLLLPFNQSFGLGLFAGYNQSLAAVQQLPLNQPIFNNFDSGSFLIFATYPERKVFVDNRAEAYPDDFLQNTYIAAQENDQVWQDSEEKYGFKTIIYYRHDMTNWGQEFLITRVQDKSWVPIYVDNYLIIFVKDIPENQELIDEYRLPPEMFSIK